MAPTADSTVPPFLLRDLAGHALREDLGRGDVTSRAVVPAGHRSQAIITARESMLLAGLDLADAVFNLVDPSLEFSSQLQDGSRVKPGTEIARITGTSRSILAGERTALNFLQHLCGVATLAARAVESVAGSGVRLLDTRKTTPGMRILEKHATVMGGFSSHRSGLDDGVLIKENHISCCGSAAEAVRRARTASPVLLKIQVEITSQDQLEAVLAAGADLILLDNFSPDQVLAAVEQVGERARLEASGGITLDNLPAYAATGVHQISVGFVTHSAPAVDLSLLIHPQVDSHGG